MLAPSLISGSVFVTLRGQIPSLQLGQLGIQLVTIHAREKSLQKYRTLKSKGSRQIAYLFSFTKKIVFYVFCITLTLLLSLASTYI